MNTARRPSACAPMDATKNILLPYCQRNCGRRVKIMGRVRLVDCRAVARESFMEHAAHHRVKNIEDVNYKNIYAWVLVKAERFDKPFRYRHAPGAVMWIKTRCD